MSAQIVITRDWDEVRQAMGVVHDTFCEAGFLDPRPSGLRMIPAYLNPGTTLLLGLVDGEPAAATALIPDGPFGLPSDRAFVEEIDTLRGEGPLFEVGSLGILPWARRHSRELVSMAFAASYRVLVEGGLATRMICSVEPSAVRYYGSSFDIRPVCDQERPLYGAPARLISATAEEVIHAARTRGGAHRRMVTALIDDPHPDWLVDRRESAEWPAGELGRLLEEAGAIDRLIAQLEVAGPALQSVLSGEASRPPFTRRPIQVSRRATRRRRRATRTGPPPLRVALDPSVRPQTRPRGSGGPPVVPPGAPASGDGDTGETATPKGYASAG